MTTKPRPLQKGDLVAIVAPSGRLNEIFPQRIERARTFLEDNLGFKVKVIFDASVSSSPFPEAVHKRCAELHAAFADPAIKGIICAIGGLSCNELLRHLDYDLIRANPKVFCGYSDITLLHHAFATQAGLRTFYGPAAIPQWGEFPVPQRFTSEHFVSIVCESAGKAPGPVPRSAEWTQEFLDWSGKDTSRARKMQPNSGWRWLQKGKATGKLSGGCLPSLCQLTGTKYWPDLRGAILLLENPEGETESGPFPLDFTRSNIADLVNVGVFDTDGIAGLVLGRPFQYTEEMTRNYERVVLEQCEAAGWRGPVLAGFDAGHTDPILTLPLLGECRMDSDRDEFVMLEAAVLPHEDD